MNAVLFQESGILNENTCLMYRHLVSIQGGYQLFIDAFRLERVGRTEGFVGIALGYCDQSLRPVMDVFIGGCALMSLA